MKEIIVHTKGVQTIVDGEAADLKYFADHYLSMLNYYSGKLAEVVQQMRDLYSVGE